MNSLQANIKTNKGIIHIKLHDDLTPITVASFVNLAKRGFYNGIKFHRVIPDFVIQAGCPLGTGTGGPGYRFEDEFSPKLRHNKAGILSMANAGPGTNGSQFFITHGPTPHLDNRHSVFGEVVSEADLKVVNSIQQGDVIQEISIEGDDSSLMQAMAGRVKEWNSILDKNKH
jgi:peptidyl-prolyl cis-trans isomerase B (cyclophilin B)